jgi:hypothetical protein
LTSLWRSRCATLKSLSPRMRWRPWCSSLSRHSYLTTWTIRFATILRRWIIKWLT